MSEDRLIRLANLRKICAARGLDARGLCDALGSRYTYWRDMLEGEKPSFGEKIARRIEDGLTLPRGWMDIDHSLEATGTTPATGSATLTSGAPTPAAEKLPLRTALMHIAEKMREADPAKREVVAVLMREIALRPEAMESTLTMLFQMLDTPDAAPVVAKPTLAQLAAAAMAEQAAPALPANVHAIGEHEVIGLLKTKDQKAAYRAAHRHTPARKK